MKRLNLIRAGLIISLLAIVIPCMAAKAPPKPDMTLTLEDGRDVTLHPDSTWEFVKFVLIQDDVDDIYMDLDGGQIICLKMDNTWAFVKKKPVKNKAAFAELPDVQASASATHAVLDQAVQMARKQVFERSATRLLSYAKKSKLTQKYLIACIKDEVGEEGAEVSYIKGWTATAKLSLSKVQVNKILDCVIVQVDAGTGAEAGATPVK